ncbi:Serine_peptidase [Hexamita inflata]|uniref:Serine peptidase n=1 Tax=Hexamita inflata TaxID=28002 RepID=A0AA86UCK4_9EUKA|nr:Serine peptidase [Hexamita inflata]
MLFAHLTLQIIQGQNKLNSGRMEAPNEAKIFKQRLDHFAFNQNYLKLFDQRYFVNENFLTEGVTVDTAIIEIGGEGTVSRAPGGTKTNYDVLGEIAMKYNAPIFELEHRFYGESQPFAESETPLASENLKYLSSRHAIADLVNFIYQTDKQYCIAQGKTYIPGKTCLRWMIAGGSYAGAVSAWITQQHPHLFAASISSSGVVDAHYELPEFDSHTYAAAGTPCAQAYTLAMRQIEQVTESGSDKYLNLFKATREHLSDFYYFIADSSLMVFQYGDWNTFCPQNLNTVWKQSGDVTEAFVQYLAKNYEYAGYDRDSLKKDVKTSSMFRQWWYQTCTEVAYYQPAPVLNSIRSKMVTTEWHLDICKYAFGLELMNPTERTNNYYGNTLVYGPDTYFSNFWQDVWHIVGVTAETKNVPKENIGYINCRDCGHCVDLHVYKAQDPQSLKDMRKDEVAFVSKRFDDWAKRV